MATRNTRLVIKNSLFPSQTLPSSGILQGEGLVNLGDGILYFSGGTSGLPTWVPSNNNAGYFEVGSNLYQLKIRDKIVAYSGLTNLSGKFLSGTTSGFVLGNISDIYNPSLDTYVTGSTLTSATNNIATQSSQLLYHGSPIGGPYTIVTENIFTTGGTYDNGTGDITFDRNNGTSYTVDLSSLDLNDTFVTGFTYNPANNTFTITRNEGEPILTASINSVSGITVSSLTPGRVVYVGAGGQLTDESGFEYNDSFNLLTVGNIDVQNASGTTATIGQGGLTIGSGGSSTIPGIGDLLVHGNLTVFGSTTTISTSELYIEDPQITLNYNPTGNTSSTSISSGLRIQDGDGLGNDVFYTIAQMNTFTGGPVTEYTGPNGYTNRAFLTQLNDIVIRNTNNNNGAPNGKRVLAEDDILDGGSY